MPQPLEKALKLEKLNNMISNTDNPNIKKIIKLHIKKPKMRTMRPIVHHQTNNIIEKLIGLGKKDVLEPNNKPFKH